MVRDPRASQVLTDALLRSPRNFRSAWLRENAEEAVPFLAESGLNAEQAADIAAGARAVGEDRLVAARTGLAFEEESLRWMSATESSILSELPWQNTGVVIALRDLTGALLMTTDGYAIAAGPEAFVGRCVRAGTDEAKRQFARYANDMVDRQPDLFSIAQQYGCAGDGEHKVPDWMTWSRASQVSPGSAVDTHLSLMRELVAGTIEPRDFETAWWETRRRDMEEGERASGQLSDALRAASSTVEDYVADPELRDPGDLDDEALVAAIAEVLKGLK
ncbi:MAG: hypothetical protein QOE54_4208 [Streptosporangiaceae bacterium]|nr:hypothetical protein [Streptosporangiaceae bacterium]